MTGPLAELRILDLSKTLAGPFCTMNLGDMGADVIKVEEPTIGDEVVATLGGAIKRMRIE